MGVLDSILAYKAQKDAQARADIDAIPQGIAAFTAAKQVAQKSLLDQMTYNMSVQKFNMEAQRQPYELEKLRQDVDPNSPDRKVKQQELEISEQKAMNQSGYAPTSRRELLTKTPTDRRDLLASRQQGSVTGKTYVKGAMSLADLDNNPDIMLAGYSANGKPYYKSRSYGQFQRELVTENPNIDVDTQKAIAGYEFAEPRIQRIESLIDSGAMGDDASFKKFTDEIFVKGTGAAARYAVKDGSPLEGLMSDLNAIKTTGFSIAGTAYTDSERENIEYGLDPRGKSRAQFKSDIRIIQDYLVAKSKSGTIGLKEARNKVAGFESLSNKKTNSSDGSSKSSSGVETLIDPNGVRRKVSADKIEAALKAGFKRGE